MFHFELPSLHPKLYTKFDIHVRETIPRTAHTYSLSYYLNDIKSQMDDLQTSIQNKNENSSSTESIWDKYKKYTNPYEYIHTVVPLRKHSVCKLRPLSRAFYKMMEILHQFPQIIFPVCATSKCLRTFHLAEGPGGFIEAVAKTRATVGGHRPQDDVYIGMTLMDPSNQTYSIPAWKKSDAFLREYPQVKIETGADGTGNLLVAQNFKYLYETYGGTMDLVTGDGGFDFSTDFDHQEVNILPLLYAQIACAVCMQTHGGSFVLKIFDLFTTPTLDLLALLSSLYDHVSIIKPVTSRYANSEKYVVCTGFRLDVHELPELFQVLYQNFVIIARVSMSSIQQHSQQHSQQYQSNMNSNSLALDSKVEPPVVVIRSEDICVHSPTLGGTFSLPHLEQIYGCHLSSLWCPDRTKPSYIHRILTTHTVPCAFIHAVAEYNTIVVQQQIENIHFTMNLIREDAATMSMSSTMHRNIEPHKETSTEEDLPPSLSCTKYSERKIRVGSERKKIVEDTSANSQGRSEGCVASLTPSKGCVASLTRTEGCDLRQRENPATGRRLEEYSNSRTRFISRKIQILLRNNVQKCIQWCMKHRLPYHNLQ